MNYPDESHATVWLGPSGREHRIEALVTGIFRVGVYLDPAGRGYEIEVGVAHLADGPAPVVRNRLHGVASAWYQHDPMESLRR